MAELRRATFYIYCKHFYQIVFVHVWWFHAPLPVCAHHHTFVETCKQPRVYQFPGVILSPSVPSLHMIIDRIKRGPFNGVEGVFDLHSHSRCNGVPLMQWNLSLAQGGVEGERRAFLFFFFFDKGPPSLVSISLSSLSTLYESVPLKYTN